MKSYVGMTMVKKKKKQGQEDYFNQQQHTSHIHQST